MLVVPTVLGRPRGAFRTATATVFLGLIVSSHAAFAQQPPAATTRPATHTVKRGDTLWDIARLYLGDPFLWPEIYRINTDLIEDPHWIYPGEVLKLPQESQRVVAEAPPARVTPLPPAVAPAPVAPAPDTAPPAPVQTRSMVRMGEFIASPWVDRLGGPKAFGEVIGGADLPAVSAGREPRMNLYDPVLLKLPAGSPGATRELYLTYRLGPFYEDLGQIIVPTGVVQLTRPTQPGEAAVGRVVKLFNEMVQGQRLIPLDSTGGIVTARPVAVENGRAGKVRWIYGSPVLASLQSYVVVDIGTSDVATGDQLLLYRPRQRPKDEGDLAIPEVPIAHAQVLRVTPYGAAAVITSQEQPKIEQGVSARVTARMP